MIYKENLKLSCALKEYDAQPLMVCYGIKICKLVNKLHLKLRLTQQQQLAAEATIHAAFHNGNLIFTLQMASKIDGRDNQFSAKLQAAAKTCSQYASKLNFRSILLPIYIIKTDDSH
ncbi:MAG: hypothetical protein RMX65_017815 [Nostoc sp. DedQUE01]|nr:hypothetical protein [Nostoc sp. DedQUE01]